jgi:hypothetical protein
MKAYITPPQIGRFQRRTSHAQQLVMHAAFLAMMLIVVVMRLI